MTKARIVKRTIIGLVATVVIIIVIIIAGLFIFSGSIVGPALAPLQLPQLSTATKGASAASPDGTWMAGDGSLAGFRVNESFLVQSGTIVGRTKATTGSLVIAHNTISSGTFQVDLRTLTISGKPNTSFSQLLNTSKYPNATLTLTKPIVFNTIPTNGQTIASNATASLVMHGITHIVALTILARSNGSVLEAIGSIPLLATDWGIESPFGIQNSGMIEFLVVLRKG